MSSYSLLIFDWDGTLVDSIERIVQSLAAAAQSCDLPVLECQRYRSIIGLGLPEAFASLYPDESSRGALLQRYHRHYAEYYVELEKRPSPWFDGVEDGLEAFRSQGYRLAVATGKSRAGLDRVLKARGLSEFFDVTRCADESERKPSPRMIQEILSKCAVTAQQALMVGDSCFDLDMANNAGVDSVGVSYGAQSAALLVGSRPRLIIDEFSQLQSWLKGEL